MCKIFKTMNIIISSNIKYCIVYYIKINSSNNNII